MSNTAATFRDIVRENKLTPDQIRRILNRPERTVYAWLSTSDKRDIPAHELERLVLLLFARNTQLMPVTRVHFQSIMQRVTT